MRNNTLNRTHLVSDIIIKNLKMRSCANFWNKSRKEQYPSLSQKYLVRICLLHFHFHLTSKLHIRGKGLFWDPSPMLSVIQYGKLHIITRHWTFCIWKEFFLFKWYYFVYSWVNCHPNVICLRHKTKYFYKTSEKNPLKKS